MTSPANVTEIEHANAPRNAVQVRCHNPHMLAPLRIVIFADDDVGTA